MLAQLPAALPLPAPATAQAAQLRRLQFRRLQDEADCEALGARRCFIRMAAQHERAAIESAPGLCAVALIARPPLAGLAFVRCITHWPEGCELPSTESEILALMPQRMRALLGAEHASN